MPLLCVVRKHGMEYVSLRYLIQYWINFIYVVTIYACVSVVYDMVWLHHDGTVATVTAPLHCCLTSAPVLPRCQV